MKTAVFALISVLACPVLFAEAKNPVAKVVELLEKLEDDLTSDEKAEQKVYDTYACWCEATTRRKADDIETARSDMQRLGQDILRFKGKVAVRTSEIEELEKRIAENNEAQAAATAMREKENSAWQAETAELKDALKAMAAAIGVLAKGTKASLLQQGASTQLRESVSKAVAAAPTKVLATLSPEKMSVLRGVASALTQKASYAPQSATIQGILQDMYTTMGINLMDATQDEAKSNRLFEDFIAEKEQEMLDDEKTLAKKNKEKTEAEAMLAESTEAFDLTSKQLEADVDFFDITKKACKAKTEEWQERSKLRNLELDGIKEAIKILTSDESKELFAKSIKPGVGAASSFLQVSAQRNRPSLQHVYEGLKAQATKTHNLKLAAVAAQVRMAKAGHFDKVIKAIDDLVKVLVEEQESDTKKRDDCVDEYHAIAKESAKLEHAIKNNKAMIKKLENLIEEKEEEKKKTIQEIKDTKKEIEDMTKERKKENKEFKEAKKDDEDAIDVLKEAKKALLKFYKENDVELGPVTGSVKFSAEPTHPVAAEPEAPKPEPKTVALQHQPPPSSKAWSTGLQDQKTAPAKADIDRLLTYATEGNTVNGKPAATKEEAKRFLNNLDRNGDGSVTSKEANEKKATSLLQLSQEQGPDFKKSEDQAPDADFSDKGKRKNESKGIISIIQYIIEDLQDEITNAVKAEVEAQTLFEEAVATAEKLIEDLEEKKTNLEEDIAKAKEDKTDEETDKKQNEDDLDEEKKAKADIEVDCDYMIEKYEERRGKRDSEMKALGEAKEFLANYYDSPEE